MACLTPYPGSALVLSAVAEAEENPQPLTEATAPLPEAPRPVYTGNASIEADLLQEAIELMQGKDYDGCLSKLVQIDPEGETGQGLSFKNTKAVCLWQHESKLEEAHALFEEILLTNPDLDSVLRNMNQVKLQMKYRDFNAARELLQENKLVEAEELLRKFDLNEPSSSFLRFNVANTLGIVLVTMRKKLRVDGKTYYNVLPEAIQYFDVALEENPDCIEAMHNQALALMQMKKWDASLEYFDMALERKPDLEPALYGKATGLQNLGCWSETVKLASSMIDIMGDKSCKPFYIRGAAQFALKDFSSAIADIEKAFEIGSIPPSESPGMQQTLIKSLSKQSEQVLFVNGQPDAAVALCERALAVQPAIDSNLCINEKRHAVFNKGLALFALGDTEGAVNVLRQLVAEHPNVREAREGLGQIAILCEDYALGIENLELALSGKVDPSRTNLLYDLGAAYFKISDLDKAQQCFQRVLKIDPDHE